jgi:hypothetical protein
MTEAEDAAMEARGLELAAEFEAFVAKLRDFHASIPVSPLEAVMLLGEEDMDVATNLRSTIECGLADRLDPFAIEMKKAVIYKPPTKVKR